MKNGFKFISTLLVALVFAIGIGSVFGAPAGAIALGASAFVKMPVGTLNMAVTPEIWTDFIVCSIILSHGISSIRTWIS